jgi:antitoxin MazE
VKLQNCEGNSMNNVVKANVVRIGNSRGVRIPKLWLEQLDLGAEVEMSVQADQLVIRSPHRARAGWEDQFRAMHEHGDDRAMEGFPASTWDEKEWEW